MSSVRSSQLDRAELGSTPPATVARPGTAEFGYRLLDVTLASMLLILLSPLMLIAALAVRLDSPGPVIFRQRRLGRSLQPFTVHKFRTMYDGSSSDVHRSFVLNLIAGATPEATGDRPRFKLSTDPRVTRVGHLLRRSSLDELPQLWDVLRGDMSIVGPRPAIPYEVEHYPPHWMTRLSVKPGITGLWQVSGRSHLTMQQMIELDVEYVERRSLRLNLWIILRTLPAVLSARGAA